MYDPSRTVDTTRRHRWIHKPDPNIEFQRRLRWTAIILRTGCLLFWFFSIYNLFSVTPFPVIIPFFFAILASAWIIILHYFNGPRVFAWSSRLFTIFLAGSMAYYLAQGGENNARALWSFAFPMVAIFMLGKTEGALWTGLLLATQIMIACTPGLPLQGSDYEFGFMLRYFLAMIVVTIMTYFFEAGRLKVQTHLHRNQLLLNESKNSLRNAYEELQKTQSQLVQSGKLASIGQLASGVAHELNQPLMVIRGNAQLMKRLKHKSDEEILRELPDFFAIVNRNTKRMSRIINHLRCFSRQSLPEHKPVNINAVIEESFLLIGEQLRIRGVEVEKDFAPDLAKVMGDANQLEQVFLNLMSNARDAMDQKPRGTTGASTHKRLLITTRPMEHDGPKVKILFQDSGCGIAQQNLETIFDPFFTTKEVGKGTGLGLSISYGIVQDHAGEIEVVETSRNGTTFRIILPALAEYHRQDYFAETREYSHTTGAPSEEASSANPA